MVHFLSAHLDDLLIQNKPVIPVLLFPQKPFCNLLPIYYDLVHFTKKFGCFVIVSNRARSDFFPVDSFVLCYYKVNEARVYKLVISFCILNELSGLRVNIQVCKY